MRNNKGPTMEPCGTPYLMVWISDLSLLMVTYRVLLLRWLLNQSKATPLMP